MRLTSRSELAALILGFFVVLCVFLLPSLAFGAKAPPVNQPHVDPPSACDAVTGNLVANCGFETGLSGWTLVNSTCPFTGADMSNPHTGMWEAYFGAFCVGSYDSIEQTIATTAGQSYQLSFWLQTGSSPRDFQVYWNGTLISPTFPDGSVYTQYSFVVIGTG